MLYLNFNMRVFFLTIITLFFITGCTKNGVPLMSSGVSGTEGLPPEQLSFAKFKDIAQYSICRRFLTFEEENLLLWKIKNDSHKMLSFPNF